MSTIIDGTTGITTDGLSTSGSISTSGTVTASGLILGTGTAQLIKLETAKATTSGTAVDFTEIPTWAKKITIIFNEVSFTPYSESLLIRIGTAGNPDTAGYIATSTYVSHVNTTAGIASTGAFILYVSGAANTISGHMILTNMGSNTWVQSHSAKHSTGSSVFGGGSKTALSGPLNIVRISRNSFDTFDNGSINILIEGSL
jgi:hypothetical protein